ncbi:hypothetical protein MesoLj113b_26370 [Mesorhizobium sp. 113-3-3]|nr:hypothetical protein MesoLj113b_26370 [Mesorhizobium sp. 113-3-3]
MLATDSVPAPVTTSAPFEPAELPILIVLAEAPAKLTVAVLTPALLMVRSSLAVGAEDGVQLPDVNQLPEPDPFQVSEAPSANVELDSSSPASPSASEARRLAIGRRPAIG